MIGKQRGVASRKKIGFAALVCVVLALSPFAAFNAFADTEGQTQTPVTGFGLTYVTNSTETTWDGATIDISWYNTTDTVFVIDSAAKLVGLAAITSPLRGTLESDLPQDQNGVYCLTGVASNAVDAEGKAIAVDTFKGKTIKLGADLDMNGSIDANLNVTNEFKPIADINVYSDTAGGQGTSVSGSMDAVAWEGLFDGQGHTVSNIYINGCNNALLSNNFGGYNGFIGRVGVGSVVRNLGVTGYIKSRVAGGIAAVGCGVTGYSTKTQEVEHYNWTDDRTQQPRIENCYSAVETVNNGSGSRFSGGIFGGEDAYQVNVDIINCYCIADQTGNTSVGGVAGSVNGIVAGCYYVGYSQASNSGAIVGTIYENGVSVDGVANAGRGIFTNNMALVNSNNNGNFYRHSYVDSTGTTVSYEAVKTGFSTAEELKNGASTLGSAYVNSTDGYPILFWQAGLSEISLEGAVVAPIADVACNGLAQTPALQVTLDGTLLTEGLDYMVKYENNVQTGVASATVYGVGRYTGTLAAVNFNITGIDLSTTTIVPVGNKWRYPGDTVSAVTPHVYVLDSLGVLLTEGVDYVVSYENNDAEGVATIIISGGEGLNGIGSNSAHFNITNASAGLLGEGTEENPYLISSKYDLQFLSHQVYLNNATYQGAYYKVTCDIDAGTRTATEPQFQPIGDKVYLSETPYTLYKDDGTALANTGTTWTSAFYGTFDGDGHTITLDMDSEYVMAYDAQWYIQSTGKPYSNPLVSASMGLFGIVGNTGVTGVSTTLTYDKNVVIKNLTVDGKVAADNYLSYAAGIVGKAQYCTLTIDNCVNEATITSDFTASRYATTLPTTQLAGVIGYVYCSGTITNCVNEGSIYGSASGSSGSNIAGIVGSVYTDSKMTGSLTVKNCTNKGTLKGKSLGGIINGLNLQTPSFEMLIKNCRNEGTMIANTNATSGVSAAGIVYGGTMSQTNAVCTIENCSNTADMIGFGMAAGILYKLTSGATAATVLTISKCSNTGDITVSAQNSYAAGILAQSESQTVIIRNCYNTGDITHTNDYGVSNNASGIMCDAKAGTKGTLEAKGRTITIENCYNVGTISSAMTSDKSSHAVAMLAEKLTAITYNPITTISGLYLDNGVPCYGVAWKDKSYDMTANTYYGVSGVTCTAQAKDEAYMKSAAAVADLGSAYIQDTTGINGGYPIFAEDKDHVALEANTAKNLFIGDLFTVKVWVRMDNIASLEGLLNYDEAALSLKSVVAGDGLSENAEFLANGAKFSVYGNTASTSDGICVAVYEFECIASVSSAKISINYALGSQPASLAELDFVVKGNSFDKSVLPAGLTVGDLNNNGKINIVDAQVVYDLACAVYGEDYETYSTASGWEDFVIEYVADVNGDSIVDATDARAIQSYDLRKAWA